MSPCEKAHAGGPAIVVVPLVRAPPVQKLPPLRSAPEAPRVAVKATPDPPYAFLTKVEEVIWTSRRLCARLHADFTGKPPFQSGTRSTPAARRRSFSASNLAPYRLLRGSARLMGRRTWPALAALNAARDAAPGKPGRSRVRRTPAAGGSPVPAAQSGLHGKARIHAAGIVPARTG